MIPNGFEVRSLRAEDLRRLVVLCDEHAAFEGSSISDRRQHRISRLQSLLLESPYAFAWVAVSDNELVGYATASLELSTWDADRYMHLDCLYVRSGFRSLGIGKALMRHVVSKAIDRKVPNVQWQTPMWNERAAVFYRRLGASEQKKRRFKLDIFE